MKIVAFSLADDGLVSLTIQPTTSKATLDLAMPLTPELEQALLISAYGVIKQLMTEKSELTAGVAKLS